MITFREIDYNKDVPEIISLLNANFETHHTEEAFLWKDFHNPFGKSYGLLAVDQERIAGLRMFMRWEFYCKDRTIKAIRPVDTCTDHDYRGRGLFKKITLQGLENIKEEYELIFNTPNSNSKPGYLKMGWKEIKGDFQYKVGVIGLFGKVQNFERVTSERTGYQEKWLEDSLCQTKLSREYLEWRYKDPVYQIAKFKDGGIVIYKLSKIKNIKTIILLDTLGDLEGHNARVRSVCREHRVPLLYYLDNAKNRSLKFMFALKRGYQTVVWKDDQQGIQDRTMFTVGDLEGRL